MAKCECGCGEDVNSGQFLPGHDQRLRTSLEVRSAEFFAAHLIRRRTHILTEALTTKRLRRPCAPFSQAPTLPQSTESGQKTCRDEILECAQTVMRQSGLDHFTIPEIISCMAKRGSRYAESTIDTHIVSRMCANAPDNHAVTYRDLERTDRGEYRLLR